MGTGDTTAYNGQHERLQQTQFELVTHVCTSDTLTPIRVFQNSTHGRLQLLHNWKTDRKPTTALIQEQTLLTFQWGTLSSDLFKVQLAVLRSTPRPELAAFYSPGHAPMPLFPWWSAFKEGQRRLRGR